MTQSFALAACATRGVLIRRLKKGQKPPRSPPTVGAYDGRGIVSAGCRTAVARRGPPAEEWRNKAPTGSGVEPRLTSR